MIPNMAFTMFSLLEIQELKDYLAFRGIAGPKLSWESEDVKEWKEEAVIKQQGYIDLFQTGDFETYTEDDIEALHLKIGFILFGADPETLEDCETIQDYKFTAEENNVINSVIQLIRQTSGGELAVAFIFIMCKSLTVEEEVPVIRVSNNGKDNFIDSNKRVYASWDSFLKTNKIPACFYCYPKNGVYSLDRNGKVITEFGVSPANKMGSKVASKLDFLNSGVAKGCAGVAVASALTISAPISGPLLLAASVAGASSGVWTTTRTIGKLVDRKKHKQSVGLSDKESRECWMNLATGIAGAASGGILKGGGVLSTSNAVNFVANMSCAAVSGVSLASKIKGILTNGKKITIAEVGGLAFCIFFFTNSVVNIKEAMAILASRPPTLQNTKPLLSLARKTNKFKAKLIDNKELIYETISAFYTVYTQGGGVEAVKSALKDKFIETFIYLKHNLHHAEDFIPSKIYEYVTEEEVEEIINKIQSTDDTTIEEIVTQLIEYCNKTPANDKRNTYEVIRDLFRDPLKLNHTTTTCETTQNKDTKEVAENYCQ